MFPMLTHSTLKFAPHLKDASSVLMFFFFFQFDVKLRKGRRVENEEEESNEIGRTRVENVGVNAARERRR